MSPPADEPETKSPRPSFAELAAANIDGADRGIECPLCGCRDLRVVYTRPQVDECIMRRRQCRYCGRRVTTIERPN
jgi:DNA-directed RNA polymerase subunit RPC12/RpoP